MTVFGSGCWKAEKWERMLGNVIRSNPGIHKRLTAATSRGHKQRKMSIRFVRKGKKEQFLVPGTLKEGSLWEQSILWEAWGSEEQGGSREFPEVRGWWRVRWKEGSRRKTLLTLQFHQKLFLHCCFCHRCWGGKKNKLAIGLYTWKRSTQEVLMTQ